MVPPRPGGCLAQPGVVPDALAYVLQARLDVSLRCGRMDAQHQPDALVAVVPPPQVEAVDLTLCAAVQHLGPFADEQAGLGGGAHCRLRRGRGPVVVGARPTPW